MPLLIEFYNLRNVEYSRLIFIDINNINCSFIFAIKNILFIQAGDPQELGAITEVFCSGDRMQPLLIGSVKSNMGHSEPASGLCAMIKVYFSNSIITH